jgi:hypothetical protein
METAVLVVGVVSIFVAIYFGVRALQKKSIQEQMTRGGSAVQPGRDTKISNEK